MVHRYALIIGAGRIGQALAGVIRHGSSGATIAMWDNNPRLVADQRPLSSVVPAVDIIFCCTPSWTVRDVVTELNPLLAPTTVVVVLAKGCEATTGKTMAEVLAEALPNQPSGVLGGPMLAEALAAGHRGIGVFGCTNDSAASIVDSLFADTPVMIHVDHDANGVALCGCLKNIYAFLIGMSYGLDWSDDRRQEFFTVATQEFLKAARTLKVNEATVLGPAGLGDFVETATSPSSKNHRAGVAFAQHGQLNGTSEASTTLPSIIERLQSLDGLPLMASLPAMLSGKQPITNLARLATAK